MKKILLFLALCSALAAAQVGIGSNVGIGSPTITIYQSFTAGTQIHAAANHWGNSSTAHSLIDTLWVPVGLSVSKMAWYTGSVYTSQPSLVNWYDAGWYCIAGSCQIGKLYTHTGPLLSSATNFTNNTMVAVNLVADANTVCQSYPCTLPPGIYSSSSSSTEVPANTMQIWGDGATRSATGGADFHTINSANSVGNAMIGAYVCNDNTKTGCNTAPANACYPNCVTNTAVGGNTQVTITVNMITGQNVTGVGGSFAGGMKVWVAGLTSGTGGPNDVCNGSHILDSASGATSSTGTIKYTVTGAVTCSLEGKIDGSQVCNGLPATGAGYGCISAGLTPILTQLPSASFLGNGFFSYPDGTDNGRSQPAGPAGTQSASHSLGMMLY